MATSCHANYGKGVRMRNRLIGDLVQLIGVILLGSGLTCEIILGGHIYLIAITTGAIIFTIGTKIKGS